METTPSHAHQASTGVETHSFQAEIQQLLNLMIHSLYSHREIFLRELISNASDAIDKLKFEALTNTDLIKSFSDYEIRLTPDKGQSTLSISDNGIGMSRQELVENIGTIARSGTKKWLEMKKEMSTHPELIGQFGVGFYSSFMVADKVVLHTQKAGSSEGSLWTSTGDGSYTLQSVLRPGGHGTTITLHLKKTTASSIATDPKSAEAEFESDNAEDDFTSEWTLKSLVKKYSDFIAYPIRMKVKKERPYKNEKGEEVEGKTESFVEDETLNSQKALWLRKPNEITKEEYTEFYKHLSHDWHEPLKTIHFKAEGNLEFTGLLYLPTARPWNYGSRELPYGLSLFVKRVFIMGDCRDLLPEYLRFVKGLVDSSDLSLNVSREILQQDAQVAGLKRAVTGKILNSLKEMQEKAPEDYLKFWNQFGATLKEGVLSDTANSEKIQDLFLFATTASEKLVSFKEYVERMKPDQKEIYFITGDNLATLKCSPHLERVKKKEYEVLLLTDTVDDWMIERVREYKGKKLVSLAKDDVDLMSEEEKKSHDNVRTLQKERFKDLLSVIQEALSENVKEVRLSDRLADSPVCLVSGKWDPSARMEKILQAMGETEAPKSKRILEINPDHPLFDKMIKSPVERQKLWAEILYGQAQLAEGTPPANPHRFNQLLADLMVSSS